MSPGINIKKSSRTTLRTLGLYLEFRIKNVASDPISCAVEVVDCAMLSTELVRASSSGATSWSDYQTDHPSQEIQPICTDAIYSPLHTRSPPTLPLAVVSISQPRSTYWQRNNVRSMPIFAIPLTALSLLRLSYPAGCS